MKTNSLKKKSIFLALIIFSMFVLTTFSSGFNIDNIRGEWENKTIESHTCETNNGTLSGYVTNPFDNPIEGALIRVHFHETYEEDYSDENGYYYVDNIPICYCMKNCTCSKEGYKTESVELGITENTIYNFVLYPSDVYPVFDGYECGGWWYSLVTVTFIYDLEVVAEIWYYYHDWHLYTGPFVVDENGTIEIACYWIDFEGHQSPHASFILEMDQIPPQTDLEWEAFRKTPFGKWWVRITLTAIDDISGMSADMELYINDVYYGPFSVYWPTVEIEWELTEELKNSKIEFHCFDNACNLAIEELDGSDIESHSIIQSRSQNYNMFLQFLQQFKQNFYDELTTFTIFSKSLFSKAG